MNANELKLIRQTLKGFVDSGMISEGTMKEIAATRGTDGKTVLVTRKEACEMLKVTTQTLVNWEKSGELKPIKLAGKTLVRYKLDDIEALCR